ncbi:hypothetical protein PBT90_10870 [Algoriphagus halophytocola]|uniref:hypothetical protein n=1 Tax=Algoriphagus halophytocola TaxID=2991499 RepID=UPI0022DE100E|nr:hypothetical protein [Algoriphagus sp. TR-M9]WBL41258.1 hypothetical protein PBT90_10870 [Algoriphagus sp. TR-M9]
MKNILFITWDSDKTNYMENLFFPIFSALQDRGVVSASIFQFSWASATEVSRITELAQKQKLGYVHVPISRSLPAALSSTKAILGSRTHLIAYIKSHQIQTIIARSSMPALITLILRKKLRHLGCEIIFDADGLPIQERLDLGNLKKGSFMHKILAGIERNMLRESDKVLVRTRLSISWHLSHNSDLNKDKFFQVGNGRDPERFYFDLEKRIAMRDALNAKDELILVHSGSLGPGYALDLLFNILGELKSRGLAFQMFFLCRDPGYLKGLVPDSIKVHVKVLELDYEEVPAYLMAADLGISLRLASDSAKGLLPIKIGEYMMSGLPILLSKGIGDMDSLLEDEECSYMIENQSIDFEGLNEWMIRIKDLDRSGISSLGNKLFSLNSTLDQYERALK